MRDKKLIIKILQIGALMLAGEVIFLLPFVVTRIFRPTFLEVFGINNFQLGSAFSVYGVVAMISYFLGGPLADKFESRKLISISLFITSLAGIVLARIPNIEVLTVLYGFWGFSTILLFWAAFTKATRIWGNEANQGKAYGFVDGGRGLIAAVLASSSVLLIDFYLPDNINSATTDQLSHALSNVIISFSLITMFLSIITWFIIPRDSKSKSININWRGVREVAGRKSIWKQSIIMLCAYVAYKCTDDFSLLASDVLLLDNIGSALIATTAFWIRPLAAIGAGFLGDKIMHSKMVAVCFSIIAITSIFIYSGVLAQNSYILAIIILSIMSAGIFGLRGLYYALFQESGIPLAHTGAAVGLVSVIGFTPDIFFGPLMGLILDNNPGSLGHEYLFGVLSLFSFIGFIVSVKFNRK